MALNFHRLENITRALKNDKQTGQCFHTSFVYHGSKLLAIGMNDYSKSHKHLRYGKYKPTKGITNNYHPGLHSEISACVKLGLEDCSNLVIVNIRIDNNGKPVMSKPCKNCQRVLRSLSYKAVVYYNGTEYVKEKY